MYVTLAILIALFISYYLTCYMYEYHKKYFFLCFIFFIVISFLFRLYIPLEQSADFLYYANSWSFSLNLSEPFKDIMISLIFNLINYFVENRLITVKIIFWLIFLSSMFFYSWVIKTKIPIYKKILLFSLTYFLFSYTLLRNAISYELVFIFFYYLLNKNKSYIGLLLLAITFHFTTMIVLISQLDLRKYWLYVLVMLLAIILFQMNIIQFDIIVNKLKSYYTMTYKFDLNDLLWILMVLFLFVISIVENYDAFIKTKSLFFLIVFLGFYFINPVPTFRVSIYYIILYCSTPLINPLIVNNKKKFDHIILGSIIFFVLLFIKTHRINFEM